MRWESLFADLEAQLHAEHAADRAAQVVDLTRAERATVRLADRLRAAHGHELQLRLVAGSHVRGTVVETADTWVLLADGTRRHLVALGAVAAVAGLGAHAASAPSGVLRRLGLGHALRAVSMDRAVVRIDTGANDFTGRIDVVGADYVEVSTLTAAGGIGSARWAVPFAALQVVSSAG